MTKQKQWTILSIKILIVLSVVIGKFLIPQEEINALCMELNTLFGGYFFSIGIFTYILLLSIPYFPGIELGLALMILFKIEGILLVYLATVLSLVLSFTISRYLFKDTKLREGIGNVLSSPLIEKFRFIHPSLLLIVLLNMPGNIALGGGGGIALSYGLLRNISLTQFILSTSIAVAPLPIILFLSYGGLT